MQISILSSQAPPNTLMQVLSPSNIHLNRQNQRSHESYKPIALAKHPADIHSRLYQQHQPNSLQFSFQADTFLSMQISTTPKRREARIFSIVHSAQREKSGSRSSNNSSFKEAKPGLTLVSKEKKRMSDSIGKNRQKETKIGTFTHIPDQLPVNLQEQRQKENRANAAALKIKQPEFLKAHPLRMGRMNGTCMSKLIVQRALQEKQHYFAASIPSGQSHS